MNLSTNNMTYHKFDKCESIMYLWLMPEQSTISSIQEQLIAALEKSKAASKTLEDAKAKLAPLEEKAAEAQEQVTQLMNEYNRLTGNVPAKGRVRAKYNQTPESKLAAQEKRSYTRAINSGASEAEAKKIARDAVKALAARLGVKP
jgi:chromosome segregation ATPase